MAVEASPMEVFDGVMLSDASLKFSKKSKNAWFSMGLSGSEHMDWLTYVKTALVALGVPVHDRGLGLYRGTSKGKPYIGALLQSSSQTLLTKQHERWYSENIKIVPKDVVVTPLSVANWFMGDGSSSPDKRNDAIVTHLACCKFTFEENMLLVECLAGLGIVATAAFNRGYPRVNISQFSVNRFMNMIEEYILPSYQYKIKRRRSEPVSAEVKEV